MEANVKFCNIDQRTPEWHAWRREGLTATEARTILGQDPYSSLEALWCKKMGLEPERDLSSIPAVQYGILHEEDCRTAWEARHGDIALPVCAMSDENPIFRASFDGLNSAGEPVECKCVQRSTFQKVQAQGRLSEPYLRYVPQVQHQLLVSGAHKAFLCFWHEGEYIELVVDRDQQVIDQIVRKGTAFWQDHVLTGVKPDAGFQPSGEAAQQWAEIAAHYKQGLEVKAQLEAALKGVNEKLKTQQESFERLMGEHKQAQFAGIRITRSTRAGGVDWKALCAEKGITAEELKPFQKADVSTARVSIVK